MAIDGTAGSTETGKHTSLTSAVAGCLGNPRAERALIIYFDDHDTLHHARFDLTRVDLLLAARWLNRLAAKATEDDQPPVWGDTGHYEVL